MKKLLLLGIIVALSFAVNAQVVTDPVTFPISLRYFNAEKQSANSTVLRWLAPCQTTEARFDVESSTDSRNFTTIYSVTADQERCFQPFQFTDSRLVNSKTFYRIKLITPANVSVYSYIIPVITKGAGFELNSLWPSQVNSSAILNFSSGNDERVDFAITDLNGRVIQMFTQQTKAGNHQFSLDCSNYRGGYYIIKAVNSKKEIRTLRFQKL
ncbi:MAG: T9SS type A sorting domain-containing protein [Chitinophagaceae bacterium]|nr:T9SS type A sorting domain-containing protein [Chitinophagaceae bacterium]